MPTLIRQANIARNEAIPYKARSESYSTSACVDPKVYLVECKYGLRLGLGTSVQLRIRVRVRVGVRVKVRARVRARVRVRGLCRSVPRRV